MNGYNCGKDIGLAWIRPPETEIAFPDIKKPQPIGFFSLDSDRDFGANDIQLRYYKPPNVDLFPLDLNIGLDRAIHKPESARNELLDNLLKFIFDHYQKIFSNGQFPEFVSWRGLLRLLMCTPYEYRQDWCIHVTRFNNTIYLVERETEQKIYERSQETTYQKNCAAWGFKFEQYCLSESPFRGPDTSCPVNECEEFSMVFQTRLGGMNLLYGAEMDGVVSDQPLQLNYDKPIIEHLKFVELKTRQAHSNERQRTSFLRHKSRNWWCQSFLVGIEDLYVGIRNEKGLVRSIEHVETRSLPKSGAQNHWSPWVCANFLLQFLSRLKTITANENCPYSVYEFYFNARTGQIKSQFIPGKTEHSFLPSWYIELVRRHNKSNTKLN
ncbi:decapping nuclease DXO homolog [Stomoxys calcitrans]|uniref:decapping nuclease DXO homolog n=1 Tax=Stomoxys calcitrans TaxID=35570 RepID=UPI0027E2EFEF|nr:decapping nuclease DXO homolog [Stomoxys calcitrans]